VIALNIPIDLKSIFSKGIFYPAIITEQIKSKINNNGQPDTLISGNKAIYNLTRTDSLTISNFEELTSLSKSSTKKRFRFWLCCKGLVNRTVCFIELTNQSATDKTDMKTFISGAMLTFYKEGWIIV